LASSRTRPARAIALHSDRRGTGTIIALGRWVIEEACRQTKAWCDHGLSPGVVSLNVSARQFDGRYDLEKDFADALERWRINPLAVEAELTEPVLMEITQQHSDRLAQLKRLGVRVGIDDFGTAYSSLDYLAKFPLSRLKIAQELVSDVAVDSRKATLVRAGIRLSSELGIECIAEGIENKEQIDFLMEAGCHQGQGHYFGKPIAAAEMTVFLQDAKAKARQAKANVGPQAPPLRPSYGRPSPNENYSALSDWARELAAWSRSAARSYHKKSHEYYLLQQA